MTLEAMPHPPGCPTCRCTFPGHIHGDSCLVPSAPGQRRKCCFQPQPEPCTGQQGPSVPRPGPWCLACHRLSLMPTPQLSGAQGSSWQAGVGVVTWQHAPPWPSSSLLLSRPRQRISFSEGPVGCWPFSPEVSPERPRGSSERHGGERSAAPICADDSPAPAPSCLSH